MLFASDFDRKKHLSEEDLYNPYQDINLSFDFNVVNSCLVIQHDYTGMRVIREYRETGWDLQRLCAEIRHSYGQHRLYINGDASGYSRSATSLETAYSMIRGFLDLSWDHNFRVQKSNPSLIDSRNQVNFILKNFEVKIHTDCKGFIADLEAVQTDENGGIDA